MTKKDKLLEKFLTLPTALNYKEIERILIQKGCEMISAKSSHRKFKHPNLTNDFVIPVHNNDCKDFYKKAALKWISQIH